VVEGARLESAYTLNGVSGVRIPLSPPCHTLRRSRKIFNDGREPGSLERTDSIEDPRPERPWVLYEASPLKGKAQPIPLSPHPFMSDSRTLLHR
jgi:hypothetical protein